MNTGCETWRDRCVHNPLGMTCLLLRVPSSAPQMHWIMQVFALLQSAHAAGDARSVLGHQVLVGVVVAGEHAHHGADGDVGLRWR